MMLSALAAVSLMLMQGAAAQPAPSEEAKLEACIEKIAADPEEAYEDAMNWTLQGNRPAARQCLALALVGTGRADEGAARLEQLANDRDSGSIEQRADYLVQAGHAWIQAGAPEAAIVTFSNAMKINGEAAGVLVDRASAQILAENTDAASADLEKALALQPTYGPALQMRAKLRLEAGKLDLALADVKAAMQAEPDNIDTLVLRGRVREAIRVAETKKPG